MEVDMFLSMAVTFLIVAIISGVLGFGVMAGTAAMVAKKVFFISLVTLGISVFMTGQQPHDK